MTEEEALRDLRARFDELDSFCEANPRAVGLLMEIFSRVLDHPDLAAEMVAYFEAFEARR